jgi:hypothetical protein
VRYIKISNTLSPSRGARRPRFAFVSRPSKRRARGKPGADCTHGRAQKCASDHRFNRIIRLSLRNGLRLMACSSRGDQLCSPRRFGIDDAPEPGRAKMHLPKLDASLGRRNDTLLLVRAHLRQSSRRTSRGPTSSSRDGWQRRSSARRSIAHGKIRPAIPCAPDAVASIASHPRS